MTDAELRTIEQSLHIAAPPETVWQYWVDPDRMLQWWGVAARLDPRAGGEYRVEMQQGPVMMGEFLELDAHKRLVFSFGWDGNPAGDPLAPGSTRVEVTLEPEERGTRLTLRHELPASHASEHDEGWRHYLGILAERAGAS